MPPSCSSRSWCRRTNRSLCRAGIASHTSTSPHMATHSRTAHTYSHAVCTHLQCTRNGCCAFACFYLSNITKAHYHCDTLANSVTQTECQTDAAALTSYLDCVNSSLIPACCPDRADSTGTVWQQRLLSEKLGLHA